MRVRRQSAADLATETVQLPFAEPSLEKCTGVNARGSVALKEDLVTEALVGLAAEEVVESNLVERGG